MFDMSNNNKYQNIVFALSKTIVIIFIQLGHLETIDKQIPTDFPSTYSGNLCVGFLSPTWICSRSIFVPENRFTVYGWSLKLTVVVIEEWSKWIIWAQILFLFLWFQGQTGERITYFNVSTISMPVAAASPNKYTGQGWIHWLTEHNIRVGATR